MFSFMKYEDLDLFKKDVTPVLEQDEVANNLALGILQSVEKMPLLMAVIQQEKKIRLTMLQTLPEKIILSAAGSFSSKELQEIANLLDQFIAEIPGFIGERKMTSELATIMAKRRGTQVTVEMDQGLYKLEKVKRSIESTGKLRLVTLQDLELVKEWLYQFSLEVRMPIALDEAGEKAENFIEKGRLMVWEIDGNPVSIANGTRPTTSNITISFVYTPPQYRKKGYASDCVAALTQAMLDMGYKTTSLYTDLSNPTSNKIYQEIGYEQIMESIVIGFGETP